MLIGRVSSTSSDNYGSNLPTKQPPKIKEPDLNSPQAAECNRDSHLCVCQTRLATSDFQRHLFTCPLLQRLCRNAKWPTMYRQSAGSTTETNICVAFHEFAAKLRQFKATLVSAFWENPGKHLKGLLSLDDFRSPHHLLDVYRCHDCHHTFSGLPVLVDHFRSTLHCLVQCAECDVYLWNWVGAESHDRMGETYSMHTKRSKHVGIQPPPGSTGGIVRYRETIQFRATEDKSELTYLPEQYECTGCKRVFSHPLAMLYHLTMNPGCHPPATRQWVLKSEHPLHTFQVQCNMCDLIASPQKMHLHCLETVDLMTPHDSFFIPHESELLFDFLVPSNPWAATPPAFELEHQCDTCGRGFGSLGECQSHMIEWSHGVSLCGALTAQGTPCGALLLNQGSSSKAGTGPQGGEQSGGEGSSREITTQPSSGQRPAHHTSNHDGKGDVIGNACLIEFPRCSEVVVDRTSIAHPHQDATQEVQSEEWPNLTSDAPSLRYVDLGHRQVYQCSYPGCFGVFTHESMLQEHLYKTTHGMWMCCDPSCMLRSSRSTASSMLGVSVVFSWMRHELGDHTSECGHTIPNSHHLVSKRHPDDFIVILPTDTLVQKFPSTFTRCSQCGMALEKDGDEGHQHHLNGECLDFQLHGRYRRSTIGYRTMDRVAALESLSIALPKEAVGDLGRRLAGDHPPQQAAAAKVPSADDSSSSSAPPTRPAVPLLPAVSRGMMPRGCKQESLMK